MNDSLYQILIIGLSVVVVISLAMLFLSRPKTAAAGMASPAAAAPRPAPVIKVEATDPHALSLVKWDHPANKGVLAALRQRRPDDRLVDQQAEDGTDVPGAHPDITAYVFETLKAELPDTCRWIVYSRPALVHPKSGVIFAFGIGSDCVALRLPLDERGPSWTDECLMEDDCISIDEVGADWSFMQDVADSNEPLAAYEYAAWL
jgi:hypothetical protein